MQISGSHVVITGASQGIGAAMARAFSQSGARVLLIARSADKLAQLGTEIGADWLVADLTDAEQLDSLVARCADQIGHIDVWVNNAGVETDDAFAHTTRADIRSLARLNFEAPLLLTRDVLPHMLSRNAGHLVMVSSVAGAIPFPGLAAYAGSKAGLTNFSETLRLELKGTGIGLTVVAPGPVDTAMWNRLDTPTSWQQPALTRFRHLMFLPKVDPVKLGYDVVDAVVAGRRFVRPKRRYGGYHGLNNLPRRLVELALTGVRMPPLRPVGETFVGAVSGFSDNQISGSPTIWKPIWATDNPPSSRWQLYTRGNVGEVFPEVVLPLTWDLYGRAAERGWRRAFEKMGLLMPDDFLATEDMVILSVFGGYCYINASFVRLLGVRAPGGTVEAIDKTFFGESDAPAYRPGTGHKNKASSLRLGRTIFRLLGAKHVPGLTEDKAAVREYLDGYPGNHASDEALVAHIKNLVPLFEQLFFRHIDNTFSVALVSGALVDLTTKAGKADLLVSILGGIGDIESAAPSAAMWKLARQANYSPAVSAAFDAGVSSETMVRLRSEPSAADWVKSYDAFINEFGSRGPNEWDIGSDPWEFRPQLALAAIDRMRAVDAAHDPAVQLTRLSDRRVAAVQQVRRALNPVDRFQFDKALRATTLYSQARERSKTTIIAAIHGARTAHAELARRIAERGGPSERWKACLYSLDEFTAALDDPAQFANVIADRSALHAELSAKTPPFIVDRVVPDPSTWSSRNEQAVPVTVGERLQGIAGCPGVARGLARVVLDPGDPRDLGPGDVLVAPITDPSWTPLFLTAEAVVVDVGATMSHAVIVSRELGIPCVVSAVGATRRIPDGALIEVDGDNGTVTILSLPSA